MMKKVMTVLLTALLSAGLLAGCGGKDTSAVPADGGTDTENTEAKLPPEEAPEAAEPGEKAAGTGDKTTLTVGFDAEFPPYGYRDENGDYVGFDLSLAQEVCNRLGFELVKQPIDWDSKDMELSSGAIDCIWNGFTINGREDAYEWTIPYVDNSQVFVVASDSGIADQAGLAGKVVAVQKDSSAQKAINSEDQAQLLSSFAEVMEFGDYNTAFLELQAGSVDAIAMDIGVADYQMESRDGEFVMLSELLATEKYGVGFLKGNTELKDQVENTLVEMMKDGTFIEIAKEWGLEDSVIVAE